MISRQTVRGRIAPVIAIASLGVLLAACDTVTYGTGVGPTEQTFRDITNVFNIGQGGADIDYQPRPGLVTPPNNQLPPPTAGEEGALQDNDATLSPMNNRAIPVNSTPTPTGPSMKLAAACEDVEPIFRPPAGYCEMGPADQASSDNRRGVMSRFFGEGPPPVPL